MRAKMREVKFKMVWGMGLDCWRLTATSFARGYAGTGMYPSALARYFLIME